MSPARPGPRPLDGIRVLEAGQLMAGPFAGTMLAWFGADVIKVEPPDGDPVRSWRVLDGGTSLWWRSLGRNKRSIVLDLRTEDGRDLFRRLAARCDVLIENFRPGTMERWGLGPDDLRADHADLVYARVSGFGQTGPYASRGGYASVCEAMGGLRHVTGHPGEVPVRANLSLGDSLAAFHAVIGVLLALVHRLRGNAGQVVDVSIVESVLNVMEAAVTEYDRCGVVREPSGTTITGVVPTDAYPCAGGRHVVIGANGDSVYRRLMQAIGRDDLAADPRLATNDGRVAHQALVDEAIAAWTREHTVDEVLRVLEEARVPAGPINAVDDIVEDEHFRARGLFEEVDEGGRRLVLPALAPRLEATPGRTERAGGEVGEHTDEVLETLLGLDRAARDDLRRRGVIVRA